MAKVQQIDETNKLGLATSKLELIAFISEPDTSLVFSDTDILLNNFLHLLQGEFCTKQDYREFLVFHTRKYILANL